MATTYDRLHVLLQEAQNNDSERSQKKTFEQLVTFIQRRATRTLRLKPFLIRRNTDQGVVAQAISKKSIMDLYQLLRELGFVEVNGNQIGVTPLGNGALEGENYPNYINTAVFELLKGYRLSRDALYTAITDTKIPEPEEIYSRLSGDVDKETLTLDLLKKLLFLLACAKKDLVRSLKVIYVRRRTR